VPVLIGLIVALGHSRFRSGWQEIHAGPDRHAGKFSGHANPETSIKLRTAGAPPAPAVLISKRFHLLIFPRRRHQCPAGADEYAAYGNHANTLQRGTPSP
jgi:hypothetical protein